MEDLNRASVQNLHQRPDEEHNNALSGEEEDDVVEVQRGKNEDLA